MEMCLINMLQQLITEEISEKSKETFEDFYNLNSNRYKKVKTDENYQDIYEQEEIDIEDMTYEEFLKCYRLKENPEMKEYLKERYNTYLEKVKNGEKIKDCITVKPDNDEELGEQDDGTETGTSSAGEGAGTASMTAWESGVSRGAANPIGVGKWSETYGITRGKSNPVW